MFAAPLSWRVTIRRSGASCSASRTGQVALAGDAEGQVGPVQHELVDQDLPAAARQRRTGCSRKIVARWVLGLSASAGST